MLKTGREHRGQQAIFCKDLVISQSGDTLSKKASPSAVESGSLRKGPRAGPRASRTAGSRGRGRARRAGAPAVEKVELSFGQPAFLVPVHWYFKYRYAGT